MFICGYRKVFEVFFNVMFGKVILGCRVIYELWRKSKLCCFERFKVVLNLRFCEFLGRDERNSWRCGV